MIISLDQETSEAEDKSISLPIAALLALRTNPRADTSHRLVLAAFAALANPTTGAIGIGPDRDMAALLGISPADAMRSRLWLTAHGYIIETRHLGHVLPAKHLGPAIMSLINPPAGQDREQDQQLASTIANPHSSETAT